MVSKISQLLMLLPRSPSEFYERLVEFSGARLDPALPKRPIYNTVDFEEGITAIVGEDHPNLAKIFIEGAVEKIEEYVSERKLALPPDAPFVRSHNGDALLGRLCYALARSIRPRAVVETGVCYGVASAYLLAALETNRDGHLFSIDLPPLGKNGDDYVGWLVPRDLRRRWTIERGTSRRLLRPLSERLGPIDMFVHDSQHTYKNMKFEFETAWPALRPGGVLISDDVEGNGAFSELTLSSDVADSAVIREKDKDALVGVAVKRQ